MSLDQGPTDRASGDGHAVVIGSSLAGLTAAQALVDHMDRVTVIERDRLPLGPRWRRGVGQSRHAHTLMAAGHRGLEPLFPGITRELLAAGMVSVRMPEDILLLGPGGWIPRFATDLTMMTGSRDILDAVVRNRLRADPKVTFLQEHEVVGLREGRNDTVTGVWVRRRDSNAPDRWGERRLLPASFVVDASGRTSRAPQWLRELGYDAPKESVVDARTACATAVFAPPVGHVADWKSLLLTASPDDPRQGVLTPLAGGKWIVSLFESGGVQPPTDHETFLRAAGALRHPILRQVVERATPLGPVYASSHTENRRRHYENLRRWPDQFLVMGDALVALNPSYGHGMSVAVQSALLLDSMLRSHGTTVGVTYRLRHALARQVEAAWRNATTSDLKYPWAEGTFGPGPATRIGRRYIDRVAAVAPASRAAATVTLELGQLLVTPTAALRPRVLAAALFGRHRPVPADPPSTTHGDVSRRRRRPVVPAPTVGVSTTGVPGVRAAGSSAHWAGAAAVEESRPRPRTARSTGT
ncbi:FAD-dependent oxidoreductase [Streptomyces sp.]|uniref:FAD-dependent oxidoreductase n=1 Tax=Streptomyces sp. TaxID=1931 RepID=UPI002D792E9D|nr:FAD-dependent monooxygenase [Streptomyces sp.]HET6356923.1 FAD-dependent monooxygenase [Streptomyces sp.]